MAGSVLFWTAVLLATKMAILFVIGKAFRLMGQDRWLFTLGLAQAGEFGFVLISFALGNAVLSQESANLLLLVVAFSMLLTPLLFILYERVIAPRYARGGERAADDIDENQRHHSCWTRASWRDR